MINDVEVIILIFPYYIRFSPSVGILTALFLIN